MILLLDIGNTRIKFAWLLPGESGRHTPVIALEHHQLPKLGSYLPQPPLRVLASNVAGSTLGQALEDYSYSTWGLAVQWHDARHGQHLLHNSYPNSLQLGADRWLALLGLLHHVRLDCAWQDGSPCLLASFGTATTIDTIFPANISPEISRAFFAGGLILPGPYLMSNSLAQGTAQLPLTTGKTTDFPNNTHDAIASGVAAAQGGALLRQWRLALQNSAGKAPRVFISGGGWTLVKQDILRTLQQAQSDLGLDWSAPVWLDAPVLDGLASLA